MKYMQKKLVRESTGSWRTGFVSSFAGMKGGLGLLFGLIEDCEKVVFIVNVLLCLSVVINTLHYFFHQPNFFY
jgi:phage shock protein PspC (stress-responsive transcriptional regulator)